MAAQSKRTGEAKVIAARAEVESAKLMRQAADILSSAPAMQIRYLEAMQAMAKTANSKVIFLPGPSGALQAKMMHDEAKGEGSGKYGGKGDELGLDSYGGGMQQALNSRIVENM